MSERDVRRLLTLIAQRVGVSYDDVVAWMRDQNSLAAIEERILRGNYANAIIGTDAAAAKLAADVHAQYVAAGQHASDWLDGNVADRLIRFDTASPEVVARARANQLELVQGFELERYQVARQVTQRALVEGAGSGINPRRIAQDFRDSIGLTAQQEQWVANYRRALETGDYLRATGYELSSGHADRTLRRLDRDGGALTPAQVDDYVERYRQNAVTYRAETIARTEALRNAHDGADDAMQQAIGRGDIEAEQLDNEWHAGPATADARPEHQAMDGVRAPFGEDFVLPDGTRMSGPGDPRGGAEHNANCRCTKSTAFTSIPRGFSPQGRRLEEGVPQRSKIDPDKAYVISPSEIRDRLYALPGGGQDAARMQSIRNARANGTRLAPVQLAIDERGNIIVGDGRHRLLTAIEAGQDVLAMFDTTTGGQAGTVPL